MKEKITPQEKNIIKRLRMELNIKEDIPDEYLQTPEGFAVIADELVAKEWHNGDFEVCKISFAAFESLCKKFGEKIFNKVFPGSILNWNLE